MSDAGSPEARAAKNNATGVAGFGGAGDARVADGARSRGGATDATGAADSGEACVADGTRAPGDSANGVTDGAGTSGAAGISASAARRGLWSDAWRRLRSNRGVLFALGLLVLISLLAILGPLVSPYAVDSLDWQHLALAPGATASHWFGTDRLGRDLFVRTLHGVRISLVISLLASAVSLVIGVIWGAVAGYVGGRTDSWMMRFVDVLYSLPYLFIVIILTTLFTRGSVAVLLVAIGAVGWLTTARIVRGQTLSLKRREFVEAARATGVGTAGIIFRHIVPNLIGPVAVYATLTIPQMITFESFLSFLGLGVQEPLASLGSLINDGAQEMQSAPWMLLVPAAFLVSLLLCFNLVGDGLRDALDPRDR
jgi:oligopeptide transport system permease protein